MPAQVRVVGAAAGRVPVHLRRARDDVRQVDGAIGGGFGPLIATSLLVAAGGAPNYLYVAVFMLVCLLSAGAAWFAPEMNQRALRTG